ncbi:unnamed protein product [Sympodiomycopsis kandeliae]
MRLFTSLMGALALASPLFASATLFTSGKVSISTLDGSSRLSDTFTSSTGSESLSASEGIRLDSDELIRLSLITDSDSDLSQAVVQLVNTHDASRIYSWPATSTNKTNGKVNWSQRVDRLPLYRLGSVSSSEYSLRLLVASQEEQINLELGTLTIPFLDLTSKTSSNVPVDPTTAERIRKGEEMGFYRWPEIRHTFRKEVTENMPGGKKSAVVAAIFVLVPWALLLSLLLPTIASWVQLRSSPKVSTSTLFAALLFLEVIGARYYKGDFILFKMLPYFIFGSLIAAGSVLAGGVRGVGLSYVK